MSEKPFIMSSLIFLGLLAGCAGSGTAGSTESLEMLPREGGRCETLPCGNENPDEGDSKEGRCLTWELGDDVIEGDDEDCVLECPIPSGPTAPIAVHFDCTQVHVVSCKDLSNVVLEFDDGEHYKFDDLELGNYGTFELDGRIISIAWVKAGNNASGEGPGYGEHFDSDVDPGDCDGTGGTGGMGGNGGTGGGAGGAGGAGGIVVQ